MELLEDVNEQRERRRCAGHSSQKHAVAYEDRNDPQPWLCNRCNKRVVDDPYSGGFRTDLYIVSEDPDLTDLLLT